MTLQTDSVTRPGNSDTATHTHIHIHADKHTSRQEQAEGRIGKSNVTVITSRKGVKERWSEERDEAEQPWPRLQARDWERMAGSV